MCAVAAPFCGSTSSIPAQVPFCAVGEAQPGPFVPPSPTPAHQLSFTGPCCGSSGSLNLGLKIGLEPRWPEVRNQPAAH